MLKLKLLLLVMSELHKTVEAQTGQYFELPSFLGPYSLHRIKTQDRAQKDKRPRLKMKHLSSRPGSVTYEFHYLKNIIPLKK